MSEFRVLIRETINGDPGLGPALDEVGLDERVDALDQRMRTVNSLFWLGGLVGAAIAIGMVVLLAGADDATKTKWLVLYGALFVWGILIVAMVKLWHFQMQSHTRLAVTSAVSGNVCAFDEFA